MTIDDIQKMIADNEGDVFAYKATTGQRVEGCRTYCARFLTDAAEQAGVEGAS